MSLENQSPLPFAPPQIQGKNHAGTSASDNTAGDNGISNAGIYTAGDNYDFTPLSESGAKLLRNRLKISNDLPTIARHKAWVDQRQYCFYHEKSGLALNNDGDSRNGHFAMSPFWTVLGNGDNYKNSRLAP